MATLRDIRQRISGTKNMAKITQAMKMVSASKMKRAQNAIESARPYVLKMENMLSNLIAAVGSEYDHSMLRLAKDVKNIVVIVIGSDRGLCGSFNTALFRYLNSYINTELKEQYPGAQVSLITMGKKSTSFYRKDKLAILGEFPGVFLKLEFKVVKDVIENLKIGFTKGEIDRIYVCYNEFVNVIRQVPVIKPILPIEAKVSEKKDSKINVDYIFEPDKAAIIDALLPKLVDIKLWRFLLESNAAEQAARMMAMDNATVNANNLIQSLEMMYNKARQASITTEMLEIVSGADALKSAD